MSCNNDYIRETEITFHYIIVVSQIRIQNQLQIRKMYG